MELVLRKPLRVRTVDLMTERSVLLITSNGFGMGHLVRQLAIAAQLPGPVHILTLSQAAPVAVAAGATLEYCPSYTSPWIGKRAWHRGYLRDRIVALAEEVNADVIAFDGVVPYVGLLDALSSLDVVRVWIRRGVWRSDTDATPLAYSELFDLVIEPGDLGAPRDAGPTAARSDARRVGVITQAGPVALVPRAEAAAKLGIDPSKLTVLFNVGSNAIPGLEQVIATIAARANVNVVMTKDALGRNRSQANITTVSGVFPLYPYLAAVDLAVTSVGYNAAHEFTASAVPSILVPANNVTDDQRARAHAMQDAGLGLVVEADQPEALQECVERLLDDENERSAMALSARQHTATWTDGATEAATLISTATRGPRTAGTAQLRLAARKAVETLLGLMPRPARRVQSVLVTDELVGRNLAGDVAIEHIHPGLRDAYAARRMAIAKAWFDAPVQRA